MLAITVLLIVPTLATRQLDNTPDDAVYTLFEEEEKVSWWNGVVPYLVHQPTLF